MKEKIFKAAALLLSLIMLGGVFAACATPDDPSDTTAQETNAVNGPDETTEDPNAPKYDEDGYLISNLPELNFNDETVTVLYWSDVEMKEYESDAPNGELVNDAIFKRNSTVEGQLGVKLAFEKTPGNNGNKIDFADKVGNVYKAGDAEYDLISAYSRTTAICAERGYCAELTSQPYLDFTNPWWPEELVSVVSIDNKVYFASGDASINVLHFMYGVYYNKDLLASKNLPNLVELVDNNQWTISKMQEICTDCYVDLNNNGQKDKDDAFGITTTNFHIDAFYTGSGLKLVEQDPEQILIISEDFWSEKASNLCDQLGAWFKTQDAFMGSNYEDTFVAGNTLFSNNRCYLADRKLGNVTFTYGIVPTPKYDTDQEHFISVVGNPFSLYAIFVNSADQERAAAVLESWAAAAYRTTTPAQYELNMRAKFSSENDDSRMYEIIKSTVCFDIGRLFNPEIQDLTDIFFHAVENNTGWASVVKINKKILPNKLKAIVENFQKIG
ncbi:MAG: hypothetical protein J6V48_11410 [Clostridia bacterium]|nr:hypothetical protein [Clostridia bacterium]